MGLADTTRIVPKEVSIFAADSRLRGAKKRNSKCLDPMSHDVSWCNNLAWKSFSSKYQHPLKIIFLKVFSSFFQIYFHGLSNIIKMTMPKGGPPCKWESEASGGQPYDHAPIDWPAISATFPQLDMRKPSRKLTWACWENWTWQHSCRQGEQMQSLTPPMNRLPNISIIRVSKGPQDLKKKLKR